ncbi:MAG: FliA/WhiG family RNA polymerase sigma factor [Spirochaetes bacterium]|nr:FliA/WhiG family RNA polymerase sigma factor [Spirochaetota bacterium]
MPQTFDISEEEEIKLWKSYRIPSSGEALREQVKVYFIKKYSPLVKYVAGKIHHNLPETIEFDDLVGYGTLGLLDAIEKFDPTRDIKFKTYGITRIRGHIYDELRKDDWVPRSVRTKQKLIEEKRKEWESKHGGKITLEELARITGISTTEVERITAMAGDSTVGSLDGTLLVGNDNDEISVIETIQSNESQNPYNEVERSEIRKIIAAEIQRLPEKEKLVLILYYYEDLTLKEIGVALDVTESRVSQLHTKAIRNIRNSLDTIKKSLV